MLASGNTTTRPSPAAADVARAVVTARVWNDPAYFDRLRSEPHRELASAGYVPDESVTITVLADGPTCTHVVLPEDTPDADSLGPVLPLPSPGHEIRVVRQSRDHLYLVVPEAPTDPLSRIETEFALATPSAGWSVWKYTTLVEAAVVVTTVLGAAEATAIVLLI